MKRIHSVRNIIILSTIGVLTIALIVVTFIFKGNSQQSPELTSNVRASALTYKRDLDLIATASPTLPDISGTPAATSSSTITPKTTPDASRSAALSAAPTEYLTPTDMVTASGSATPSAITSLPKSGWTQNVSIMFIAASVLMFLSFLY